MSAVLQTHAGAAADVNSRLTFQKNLQIVTNKIHATSNVDEIMLEVSADICTLFNADRLTIYTIGEDKQTIVSKVKTGLNSFKDLKLPIAEHSIAGYVGLSKKMLNLKDVYDEAELKSHNSHLRFLQEVDKRTGYRTKQMLVAPVVEPGSTELVGVVQLINNKAGMPFGQLAEEGVTELCQTLAIAFKQRQKPQVLKTKYDFLVSDAVISAAEFELAARSARKKAVDVENVLIDEFQVKIPAIGAALAKFFGVPYEPFKPDRIKPMDLLKNLKREYVESNQWVPIEEAKEGLVILCMDPERVRSSRIVQNVLPGRKLVYRVTTLKEFRETLKAFYGAEAVDTGDIGDMLSDLEEDEGVGEAGGESDDGSAAADIELRVATIPSQGGVEDVVMRILAAGEPIPLDKLGLSHTNLPKLKETVSKPYGLFFVCGPTGSGKTTTLHSVLGFLNTPDTKIWTAEDPVEITQKGLRQVQVNKKAGLNFDTIMKSFLRADPDIIMVGEMRDKETTGTGIEASLTGHLVFATLHTNSAPESIIRLLDMGMDPFNFADALLAILAQRLAKRLCGKCKQTYAPAADEMKHILQEYCSELLNTGPFKRDAKSAYENVYRDLAKSYAGDRGQFVLYRAKGCEACSNTGYKGRVGLHELLIASDTIKKLIQEHARVTEILAVCLEEGMRTLKMDGIEKVLQGITDMPQVRAVCIK